MNKSYQKTTPLITYSSFLDKACKVKSFTSSTGKTYRVIKIENEKMFFLRLNANPSKVWGMDLKQVYKAYCELEDFNTNNFKPFVPSMHSPARGLLLHLKMLG